MKEFWFNHSETKFELILFCMLGVVVGAAIVESHYSDKIEKKQKIDIEHRITKLEELVK